MWKLSENLKAEDFEAHIKNRSTFQRHFIALITRNANKPSKGHRFTPNERLLCLSIYKKSAAAYRYLCSFLPLPNPTRLQHILRRIHVDCGVTKTMQDFLKEAASRMSDDLEMVCILMWDEVSLNLHVQHCPSKDKVVGLEDWGTNRTAKYADHALDFMFRGSRVVRRFHSLIIFALDRRPIPLNRFC